jgi:hypothetical protein
MWDVMTWDNSTLSVAWWFMLIVLLILFGLVGFLGRR